MTVKETSDQFDWENYQLRVKEIFTTYGVSLEIFYKMFCIFFRNGSKQNKIFFVLKEIRLILIWF